MIRGALLLALALLAGCRDSPQEVLEEASEAAARGDLVAVEALFSVHTVQRLERAWELAHTPRARAWQDLADKLTFDGRPLEVREASIRGAYAQVMARAGATERDYYLRKEDGRWRLELGAGTRWRRLAPARPPAAASEKAPTRDAGP